MAIKAIVAANVREAVALAFFDCEIMVPALVLSFEPKHIRNGSCVKNSPNVVLQDTQFELSGLSRQIFQHVSLRLAA